MTQLLTWQYPGKHPTVTDIRAGRQWYESKGQVLAAVQVRPGDGLGPNVDGLTVVEDGRVTPGTVFFLVAE